MELANASVDIALVNNEHRFTHFYSSIFVTDFCYLYLRKTFPFSPLLNPILLFFEPWFPWGVCTTSLGYTCTLLILCFNRCSKGFACSLQGTYMSFISVRGTWLQNSVLWYILKFYGCVQENKPFQLFHLYYSFYAPL